MNVKIKFYNTELPKPEAAESVGPPMWRGPMMAADPGNDVKPDNPDIQFFPIQRHVSRSLAELVRRGAQARLMKTGFMGVPGCRDMHPELLKPFSEEGAEKALAKLDLTDEVIVREAIGGATEDRPGLFGRIVAAIRAGFQYLRDHPEILEKAIEILLSLVAMFFML